MYSKLFKALRALRALILNPWLLNQVLAHDSIWEKNLKQKHGLSGGLPVVDIQHLLPNHKVHLHSLAFLDGSSLPTDLALLQSLCYRFKDAQYFEIGTWRGESVANVAPAAAQCYTLNLSAREIMEQGYSSQYAHLHGFFSKNLPNVTHLEGNSQTFDFAALQQKFDVIFIDGDHHYQSIVHDTRQVFSHLVHKSSVVVWHDYAYNPERVRPEVWAAIMDGVPAHLHRHLYQVSNTMCAVYVNEEINSRPFQVHATPGVAFELSLKAEEPGEKEV